MSWARNHAYRDGQFLLERLFSQVASDVHEANRTPSRLRSNRTFKIVRDPNAREMFSVICTNVGSTSALQFFANTNSVTVTDLHGGVATFRCTWSEGKEAEQWFDVEVPDCYYSVAQVSEVVLDSFFFVR